MKKSYGSVVKFFQINHTPILIVSLSLLVLSISVQMFNYQNRCELLKKEVTLLKKNNVDFPKLQKDLDSMKLVNDSCFNEIFILNTELTRHEITRCEIFLKYPQIGDEYYFFLTHYTE